MGNLTLHDVSAAAEAVSSAIVACSLALSTVLHLLGQDQKPWALPILAASNDLVGLVKKLRATESATAPEQPK